MVKRDYRNSKKSAKEYEKAVEEESVDIGKAFDYEKAAKHWVSAKNPKKAMKNFRMAARYFDRVVSSYSQGDPSEVEKEDVKRFSKRSYNALRNVRRLENVKEGKWHGLDEKVWSRYKKVSIVIAISIVGGLFFLSPNLTGNAISGLSNQNSNIFGVILIAIGIVASYFLIKKR